MSDLTTNFAPGQRAINFAHPVHPDAFGPGAEASPAKVRRVAAARREYYAYFALIFLATLPLALVTWTLKAARRFEMPEKGPVAAAWSQARIITPMIFSA